MSNEAEPMSLLTSEAFRGLQRLERIAVVVLREQGIATVRDDRVREIAAARRWLGAMEQAVQGPEDWWLRQEAEMKR